MLKTHGSAIVKKTKKDVLNKQKSKNSLSAELGRQEILKEVLYIILNGNFGLHKE